MESDDIIASLERIRTLIKKRSRSISGRKFFDKTFVIDVLIDSVKKGKDRMTLKEIERSIQQLGHDAPTSHVRNAVVKIEEWSRAYLDDSGVHITLERGIVVLQRTPRSDSIFADKQSETLLCALIRSLSPAMDILHPVAVKSPSSEMIVVDESALQALPDVCRWLGKVVSVDLLKQLSLEDLGILRETLFRMSMGRLCLDASHAGVFNQCRIVITHNHADSSSFSVFDSSEFDRFSSALQTFLRRGEHANVIERRIIVNPESIRNAVSREMLMSFVEYYCSQQQRVIVALTNSKEDIPSIQPLTILIENRCCYEFHGDDFPMHITSHDCFTGSFARIRGQAEAVWVMMQQQCSCDAVDMDALRRELIAQANESMSA